MKKLNKNDNKYIYDVVAKNIKRIRKEKNLTQVQLADLILYNDGFIANIENRSDTSFSLELVYVIAKALKVSMREFFIDNGKDIIDNLDKK